jgi:hypothetical protein
MYFLFCKFTAFLGTAFTSTKMEGYTQFKMIRMPITFKLFKVQNIFMAFVQFSEEISVASLHSTSTWSGNTDMFRVRGERRFYTLLNRTLSFKFLLRQENSKHSINAT